jgi:hypothetical protein
MNEVHGIDAPAASLPADTLPLVTSAPAPNPPDAVPLAIDGPPAPDVRFPAQRRAARQVAAFSAIFWLTLIIIAMARLL